MTLAIAVLISVTLQRLSELVIARRNTKTLLANGAVEIGAAHYPIMVALHASWLLGLWYFGFGQTVNIVLLCIYVVLQLVRIWVLATLGKRWTTRIITVPNEKLIARGPYRFLRHPNYCVVALEMPLLPLVFGLQSFAIIFGILNLAMLAWRLRIENQALGYSA
jgi:methyltransferase